MRVRGTITRCLWWGIAAASAVAIAGCAGSSSTASAPSAPGSPLTRSIEAFFHAISVQQVQCARATPGSRGFRSCQVEFTDNYGEWYVTVIVRRSRVLSDPGGVADWLCATACANPPGMTANTGNPRHNPGFTASAGGGANAHQTGVTGIGGVVRNTGGTGPAKVTGATGVVNPTGSSGVVNPTGSGVVNPTGSSGVVNPTGSGVVNPTGSGVVNGSGNTSTVGQTGATGIVYGTGSTGPGG